MTQPLNGTIKYVSPKGFGFIAPSVISAPNVFFSFDVLRGNAARLPQIGEKVLYEEGTSKRGPCALVVYNLSDPMALEDHASAEAVRKGFEERKAAAAAARKAFTEALYAKNKAWRAARNPSAEGAS